MDSRLEPAIALLLVLLPPTAHTHPKPRSKLLPKLLPKLFPKLFPKLHPARPLRALRLRQVPATDRAGGVEDRPHPTDQRSLEELRGLLNRFAPLEARVQRVEAVLRRPIMYYRY